jgi:hypothetical protein
MQKDVAIGPACWLAEKLFAHLPILPHPNGLDQVFSLFFRR